MFFQTELCPGYSALFLPWEMPPLQGWAAEAHCCASNSCGERALLTASLSALQWAESSAGQSPLQWLQSKNEEKENRHRNVSLFPPENYKYVKQSVKCIVVTGFLLLPVKVGSYCILILYFDNDCKVSKTNIKKKNKNPEELDTERKVWDRGREMT